VTVWLIVSAYILIVVLAVVYVVKAFLQERLSEWTALKMLGVLIFLGLVAAAGVGAAS
jgi:hypothetical protein